MTVREVAKMCHEVNRAYCAALGDMSQVPWEQAPQWQVDATLAGIDDIRNNPTLTPEQVWQAWSKTKRDAGWVWGPVKDAAQKTHPDLVDRYGELPVSTQAKDAILRAITTVGLYL